MVHSVSGLRGRDGILAVENDVFLLCFVGVRPVDLLRDGLQLIRGYGVAAVGEALWEGWGGGCLRARGWPEGGICLNASPSGTFQKLAAEERGCSQAP